MRMMLRWTVEVEKGNDGIRDGSLAAVIESTMEALNPESAYFFAEGGKRSGQMVFDMNDPAQIPQIAEPLFMSTNAAVEFLPVMNADDLRRALDSV